VLPRCELVKTGARLRCLQPLLLYARTLSTAANSAAVAPSFPSRLMRIAATDCTCDLTPPDCRLCLTDVPQVAARRATDFLRGGKAFKQTGARNAPNDCGKLSPRQPDFNLFWLGGVCFMFWIAGSSFYASLRAYYVYHHTRQRPSSRRSTPTAPDAFGDKQEGSFRYSYVVDGVSHEGSDSR